MRKLFFLIIVLFPVLVFAQVNLFDEHKEETYELKCIPTSVVTCDMMNDISLINANEKNANLRISFYQHVSISNYKSRTIVKIEFFNIKLDSIHYYNKFDISDVLIPSQFLITGKLLNGDELILKAFKDSAIVDNSRNIKFIFSLPDSTPDIKYKFLINSKAFLFTLQNRKALKDKKKDIDNYYNSDSRITLAMNDLKALDPHDDLNINDVNTQLKRIAKLIAELEKLDLTNKLNLKLNDPHSYIKKIKDLENLLLGMQLIADETVKNEYITYYKRGKDYKNVGNAEKAEEFFKKSELSNKQFAPTLYELALIDYKEKQLEEAIARIITIVKTAQPTEEVLADTRALAEKIYLNYLNEGKKLFNEKLYTSSLELLVKAENFCLASGLNLCTDDLQFYLTKTKLIIYKAYLVSASKSLNEKENRKAVELIRTAIVFQMENATIIPNHLDADLMIDKIVADSNRIELSHATILVNEHRYLEAEKLLKEVIEKLKINTQNANDLISANATLERIKIPIAYQELLLAIENGIERKQYDKAITDYDLATQMYSYNKLSSVGLVHMPLFEFALAHSDDFINQVSLRFATNNQTDKALECLSVLKQHNYAAKQAKNSMKYIGMQLAINDFAHNKDISYKSYLLKYTKNDSWYNFLEKSYIEQFEKLLKGK